MITLDACTRPQYIQVVLIPDVMMVYGNTTDPSAYIEIVSIGHLGPTANQRISGAVFEFIKKELGIDSKRYKGIV